LSPPQSTEQWRSVGGHYGGGKGHVSHVTIFRRTVGKLATAQLRDAQKGDSQSEGYPMMYAVLAVLVVMGVFYGLWSAGW
jgi:hypothetical protein